MRSLIKTGLLFAIMLIGCSGGEPRKTTNQAKGPTDTNQRNESVSCTSSTYTVKFERDATYGSTDKVIVGVIASFAIDDQNRVFIADQNQTTIQVFNPDGSYLTSLGKEGKGPAEFAAVSPTTIIEIHSNWLYVPDFTNSYDFFPTRVQVFSLENLSFSHTIKLIAENRNDYEELKEFFPKRIFPLNDGTFLVGYHRPVHEYRDAESVIRYVVQDSAGTIVSGPILEQKDRTYLTYKYPTIEITHMHSFPFLGKSLLAVSGEDRLYAVNNTEAFKIDVYDADGKHVRSFQHPFNNRAFNKSKVLDRYEKTNYMAKLDRYEGDDVALKMIREAENLPETWPALESMFFDDEDRLWVSTIIDSNEVYEWWVLKNTGAVITQFEWPRGKPIEVVNNGYLYTRETDQMGVTSIVRYRIEMK